MTVSTSTISHAGLARDQQTTHSDRSALSYTAINITYTSYFIKGNGTRSDSHSKTSASNKGHRTRSSQFNQWPKSDAKTRRLCNENLRLHEYHTTSPKFTGHLASTDCQAPLLTRMITRIIFMLQYDHVDGLLRCRRLYPFRNAAVLIR